MSEQEMKALEQRVYQYFATHDADLDTDSAFVISLIKELLDKAA